ncbi:hypothetical protein [Corynebacterium striatum]|uniref:hypothetical protein n=1 Tax=Corynebacterium striatum TaxID=43770 RepID=UPI0027B9E7C2|nr:hypothetical protein [Corynebacterium striatum]
MIDGTTYPETRYQLRGLPVPTTTNRQLHGENDEMVNVDEVTRFADYAKQRGLNIDAIIFDDAKHLSWANPAGLQWQQARRTILEQVGIRS